MPAVTIKNPRLGLLLARPLAPAGERFDYAESDQAKPEIHEDAQIKTWRHVAGRWWQMRHQQEIGDVARHHGGERLHEIYHHWF